MAIGMQSRCMEATVVFGLFLFFMLPNTVLSSQSCSSGYQFTTIPPITIVCDPFFVGYMDVVCEITAAPNKPPADIHWYFKSSVNAQSPTIRLVNGTSNKHVIINSYDHSKRILKSILRLYNRTQQTDLGQYICQGNIGSSQRLSPEPSFVIEPLYFTPPFSCESWELSEDDHQECASIIHVSTGIISHSTSVVLTSTSQSSTSTSTNSPMGLATSTVLHVLASTRELSTSNIIMPSSTIINSVAAPSTSDNTYGSIDITSSIKSSISSRKPHVISTDISGLSKSTNTLSTMITSTSILTVVIKESANASEGHTLVWLYVIVILLTSSFFVLIIILLILTVFFYCFRSSFSSSAIGDVVLRQRTRRPSDPLPPIRDSMILMSNTSSETTTKSSGISSTKIPATTTIHCSPLQNQFISTDHTLQDLSFSLQCASASGFTVYAEVEDFDGTGTTTNHDSSPPPPLPERNLSESVSTCSSHCYTLPPEDAVFIYNEHDNDDDESVTGQWSPVVIRQEQKKEIGQECDRLSLLSKSDVTLSDIDDTLSQSYHHANNLFVYQQQLPKQANSLTEQPFSLICEPHTNTASLLSNTTSHQSDQCLTSLQLLFNTATDVSSPVIIPDEERSNATGSRSENIRSSSSSSSGCTDLSKYSGDYERDPNYMRALGMTPIQANNGHHLPTRSGHIHHHTPNLLCQVNDRECILGERGLDSGMDGMYNCHCDCNQEEGQCNCDDYKSLESLTRNPSPVYMKPLWRKKRQNNNDFTIVMV